MKNSRLENGALVEMEFAVPASRVCREMGEREAIKARADTPLISIARHLHRVVVRCEKDVLCVKNVCPLSGLLYVTGRVVHIYLKLLSPPAKKKSRQVHMVFFKKEKKRKEKKRKENN